MCRKVALVQIIVLWFVAHETAIDANAWHQAEGVVAGGVAIVGAFCHPDVAQGAIGRIADVGHL